MNKHTNYTPKFIMLSSYKYCFDQPNYSLEEFFYNTKNYKNVLVHVVKNNYYKPTESKTVVMYSTLAKNIKTPIPYLVPQCMYILFYC